MILGSLLLKRKETAVHGFVRRSFFIKNGILGRPQTTRYSEKRKNHSADYAHSARGGHLKSFCATKKAAAQNNVQRPFAILLCTLCALNLGGSGGSSLRRSSLGRCSLRGSGLAGSSLRRSSLAGSSLRRSSLGNSGACGSSLRGGGSRSGRSTTAGGHASSQSQSNNSDANILEFHINDLLSLLVNVWQRAFGSTSLRCYILIRF